MVKKVIYFLLGFTLVGLIFTKLEGCGSGEEKTEKKQEEAQPIMPCMCNDPNLVFSHSAPNVYLSKGQKHAWDRPYGYETKWCAYNGKVKQLTRNGQTEMTLEVVEGEPVVMVRYYVKKH
jgi:hypothetical protein